MNKQTQDYISLKPIAERFKEIAAAISDDEIKSLIKDELRNQIRNQVEFGSVIGEMVEQWICDNPEFIIDTMKESIERRLK